MEAAYGFVDKPFGTAKALRDVWTSHEQNINNTKSDVINIIAHSLTTFFSFLSTTPQA